VRSYAFLGDALLPCQQAVVAELSRRTGMPIDVTQTAELADLDRIAGGATALLFLCGLPYTRLRDRGFPVEPLAAPVSAHDGADAEAVYRSLLLGRRGLSGTPLEQLEGLRLGINGYDSMSGWVLPVGSGLPLERVATTTVTGAHRTSLDQLLDDRIDAAPIDSMLLARECGNDSRLEELPRLAAYGPSPSPPVVVIGDDAEVARALRDALVALHTDDAGRAALSLGPFARFSAVDDAFYAVTRDCDRRAAPLTP